MYDINAEDERWLRDLAPAIEEPRTVPRAVVEAAYAAYSWRTIDTELAQLTFDSRHDDSQLVGARSAQITSHALTFTSESLTIEVELSPSAVLGQLVPPQCGELTLVLEDGSTSTHPVDECGCFAIEPPPAVPFRLQVRVATPASTDWIDP